MNDPRLYFKRKYNVNPNGILHFYLIESVKLQGKPRKYGLYQLTWMYAKNAFNIPNISKRQLYYFLKRYKKFMHWIALGKPIKTLEE